LSSSGFKTIQEPTLIFGTLPSPDPNHVDLNYLEKEDENLVERPGQMIESSSKILESVKTMSFGSLPASPLMRMRSEGFEEEVDVEERKGSMIPKMKLSEILEEMRLMKRQEIRFPKPPEVGDEGGDQDEAVLPRSQSENETERKLEGGRIRFGSFGGFE
jgi:hypothetical protein